MRTIIGLDVSKATATLSVATEGKTIYDSTITLDAIGFNTLKAMVASYDRPEVVFETTGVYSRRLEKFLLDKGILYHILNPLVAKKRLDDGSRLRKNDIRDAQGLALTEFVKQPVAFKPRFIDPVYRELMDLSRYYDQQTEDLKREKNRLHRSIQLTFPNFDDEIDLSRRSGLAVLRLFPHPSRLRQGSFEAIKQKILALQLAGIGEGRADTLTRRLWQANAISYPAVDEQSLVIKQVQDQVDNVLRIMDGREETIVYMTMLAHQLPEYEILLSIPGIGENTAVRILGEIGDVRRFMTRAQINSYIGIDLVEIQSGDYTAQRRITKHGNPHARKLLYWTVVNMISSTAKPNHIRDFYVKKQETASRRKPLLVACMDRLIKIIHYLINTNQNYSYELACSR